MRQTLTLILLVLALAAPVLTTVAAERPEPVTPSGRVVAGLRSNPEREDAAPRQSDEEAGTQDDRRRNQRGDKPKKPKKPTCFGKKATIFAKGGKQVRGTPRDDVIVGDDRANSILVTSGGVDRVCTRGGNDVIGGGIGGRLLANGGRGTDVLGGFEGDDVLIGGRGGDFLDGGSGADSLLGGRGIDRVRGGEGFDVLDGGPDPDSCQQDPDSLIRPC